jgi:hypothetical protein
LAKKQAQIEFSLTRGSCQTEDLTHTTRETKNDLETTNVVATQEEEATTEEIMADLPTEMTT